MGSVTETRRTGRRRPQPPTTESVLDAYVRGELGRRDLERLAVQHDLGLSPRRLVALGLRRRRQWLFGAVTGRDDVR